MISFLGMPATAAVRSVELAPPARDFGYFLGDTLTATATITVDGGTVLDRATLPDAGPTTPYIDIRRMTVQDHADTAGRVYRISIEYQNFSGPDAATQVFVPPYRLEFQDGPRRIPVEVPAWHVMVSPLRHDITPMVSADGLRGDHDIPPLQDGAARWLVSAGVAAMAAAALLMLARGGWFAVLLSGPAPFAAAARRIGRLTRRTDAQAAWQEGAVLLHRGFDATAGHAVLAGDIDVFLARHGRFAPARPDIERFFAASTRTFFGPAADASKPDLTYLRALASHLRRLERG